MWHCIYIYMYNFVNGIPRTLTTKRNANKMFMYVIIEKYDFIKIISTSNTFRLTNRWIVLLLVFPWQKIISM